MAAAQTTIRILLADEYSLFREALKVALEEEPDLSVVGEAADGRRAVAEAERTRPDVVVLDADLPTVDGIHATFLIKDRLPECGVLVLTHEEDDDKLVDALEAGATGYLTRACAIEELIAATRSIHRGETLIPQGMLGPLLARLIHRRREEEDALRRWSLLTRREKQVLVLLARTGDKEAVARSLGISRETARTHIQKILAKLGVHSQVEAVAFLMRSDILANLIDDGEVRASNGHQVGGNGGERRLFFGPRRLDRALSGKA